MRNWILSGGLLVAAAAAAACGGSDDDMFAAERVPLEELPELYAAAVCEAYTNCTGPLLDTFLPGEDCVRRTRTALEDQLPELQAAIDDGRIVYRGDQVHACLNGVKARSCSELLERDSDSCLLTLDGTVELGASCSMNEECAGLSYCKFDATCPGVCSELEAVDGPCRRDSDCESGLICSDARQRCERPAGPGGLCGAGNPECAPGYACAGADEETARPGNCRSYEEIFTSAAGASCNPVSGALCEPGQVCQIDTIVGSEFTASCAARVGVGADCRVAFPDQCPDSQYCAVPAGMLEGTCTPRPAPGEACGRGPFEEAGSICGPYSRCQAGVCQSLAHLGESCTTNDGCYSDHCASGVCLAAGSCE